MPVSKRKNTLNRVCFFFSITYTRCLHGLLAVSGQKKIANCRKNDKRNVAFDLCVLNMRDKERDERLFFCLK